MLAYVSLTHSEGASHEEALEQKEKEHKADRDAMTTEKAMLEVHVYMCIRNYRPIRELGWYRLNL